LLRGAQVHDIERAIEDELSPETTRLLSEGNPVDTRMEGRLSQAEVLLSQLEEVATDEAVPPAYHRPNAHGTPSPRHLAEAWVGRAQRW
jgi:hypothetical protein